MSEVEPKNLAADAARVYQEGDYENAARLFGEAASAFLALGQASEAAEMKNNQSVAFLAAWYEAPGLPACKKATL